MLSNGTSFHDLESPDPDFKVAAFFEIKYVKMVQDETIVTI